MLASSTIQMYKFGQKIKNHSTPSLSVTHYYLLLRSCLYVAISFNTEKRLKY